MKWLLLTNNCNISSKLENTIKTADKKNKLDVTGFLSVDLLKIKKSLLNYAGCIIYSDKPDETELTNLLQISGFLAGNKIPVYTNVESLTKDSIFSKDGLVYFSTFDEINNHLATKYKKIAKDCTTRLAKKKLLDKGIPFTSDCFATYIAKNKLEIVNEFLEAGMSVNSRDDMGVPMLNIACRNDNFEFVEMLLDLGAELNATSDDRGYTAVMDAVWRGNEKITKILIDKKAELNTINKEGQNNLILAVGADRLSLVKLLAENGADPDVKDMMGMSAYQYAKLFRKEKIVEVLQPFHKE